MDVNVEEVGYRVRVRVRARSGKMHQGIESENWARNYINKKTTWREKEQLLGLRYAAIGYTVRTLEPSI